MGFWSTAGLGTLCADSMGALPGEITVIEIYCTIYRRDRMYIQMEKGSTEIDRFRFA